MSHNDERQDDQPQKSGAGETTGVSILGTLGPTANQPTFELICHWSLDGLLSEPILRLPEPVRIP
jgi:hypothetical protein